MELMFVSQALKSQHCHKWNVLHLFNRKNCAWNEQRTKKKFNWAERNCTISLKTLWVKYPGPKNVMRKVSGNGKYPFKRKLSTNVM